MKKRIISVLTVCLVVMTMMVSVFAHSGRTDASGGHKDNKNQSGLGPYHYHCGGYPAHLHTNGVCPYKGGGSSSTTSSSSSTSSNSTAVSSVPKTVYATSITPVYVPSKIDAGKKVKLQATVYPSNAEDKTISWESSDESIVAVSSTGDLEAVGVGSATIIAKTSRGTSRNFTITVNEVIAESISIESEETEILIGDTLALKCAISPENTTDKNIEWISSDENVISVLKNGVITANNIGSATITATHKELTDDIDIEVKPIDAKDIKIIVPDSIKINDNGTAQVDKGSKIELKTEIFPENTTYKDVEWSIDDETIATIDEDGVLNAIEIGKVIITAKTKSGVSTQLEVEVLLDNVGTVVVLGVGAIAGGAILYYKKKKKKEDVE